MSNLNNRTQASNQRLQNRQQGLQSNINNRTNNARNNLNARDSRRINELVGDLTSLNNDRPPPTLRKEEPRGGIPSRRGYAERAYQPGSGGGDTAGIAGPLTEVPDTRTYHDDIVHRMYSSDYLLAAEICPLASMKMLDAEDREVVFNFAPPAWVGE